LLSERDQYGRTPLYYADTADKQGLAFYLREHAGFDSTSAAQVVRPSMSSLPKPYQKVLSQVETNGWKSVKWKDGFTMLHWAAEKGNEDFCKYLLQLNANPLALDGQSRSSVDCARSNRFVDLAKILQEAADRGEKGDKAMRLFSKRHG